MAARKRNKERDRLAFSLASSLPDSGGGYEISAAFTAPERRRILGEWTIAEHLVDGVPYIELFSRTAVRDAALLDGVYISIYDFREYVCVKRVRIRGLVELAGGRVEYLYSMSLAISWELGRGYLTVRPELGYQSTSLDGKMAAVKELPSSGERTRVGYRFEGEALVLEDGADFKRLTREAE